VEVVEEVVVRRITLTGRERRRLSVAVSCLVVVRSRARELVPPAARRGEERDR
jgi:hypothetical protein